MKILNAHWYTDKEGKVIGIVSVLDDNGEIKHFIGTRKGVSEGDDINHIISTGANFYVFIDFDKEEVKNKCSVEYIRAQAEFEVKREKIREEIDKYKTKLKNKKSFWDFLPYKIVKKEEVR